MKHYGPASGYTHFVWKEDSHSDTLTNRQETTNTISKYLLKFFSIAHKSNCKSLVSLLMHDEMSQAQNSSNCVIDNENSKAVNETTELIFKKADKSILQDLKVNSGHKNI